MDEQIEKKLEALGLTLPTVAAPAGSYVPALRSQGFLFIAGQLPWENGAIAVQGALGAEVPLEDGVKAARLATLNALAHAKAQLGSLDAVAQCVRVTGYVHAAPSFTLHAKVIDGASELLLQVFGEKGRHVRAAVGASSLPLNAAVEIEFTFAIA